MAETNIDPDQLRDAANRIGGIMTSDVMTSFTELGDVPTAGQFPTATWLQNRVRDRIDALTTQAKLLETTFGNICDSLNTVAGQLENTDVDNSTQIGQTIEDLKKNNSADTSSITSGEDTDTDTDGGEDTDTVTDNDSG